MLVDLQAELLLQAHLVEDRRVGLLLFDLVPDNPIHDVSAELVHSQLLVRAQHLLIIHLFVLVLVAGFLGQLPIVSVHFDLHEDKFIIVLEQLRILRNLFL